MIKLFAPVFAFALGSAANASVVNGDFNSGDFSGWSVEACALTCGQPTTAYLSVPTQDADPYAAFTTSTSALGTVVARISQDVAITSSASLLSFDFSLESVEADPLSSGSSFFDDLIAAYLIDDTGAYHWLLYLEDTGVSADPRGDAALSDVTLGAASDPYFDYSYSVDLAAFIDQTVTLRFGAFSENDGNTLAAAFDNVSLTGSGSPVSPVPLPPTLALLAFGLSGLGVFRFRLI